MYAPRGRRGRCVAQGRGRRAGLVQDPLVIIDPPLAHIGIQQVGGNVPPTQDPHVVDPPAQDPPVGASPGPSGRIVWRMLLRIGGSPLETLNTTIS
ncbi:hypothetical protein V6N13_104599 [Hibiscus sabdariffa]